MGSFKTYRDVGDFFGPFFKVEFLNSTGELTDVTGYTVGGGTDLSGASRANDAGQTTKVGQSAFRTAARETFVKETPGTIALEDLVGKINASLTAESIAGSPHHYTLTMTPEYLDGVALLDSRLIGRQTLVRVQWGYVSSSGELLQTEPKVFKNLNPRAIFGENIQIKLDGFDMFSSVLKQSSLNRSWDKTTYPTAFDIVKDLTDRVEFEFDKTQAIGNLSPRHLFVIQLTETIEQKLNDWEFFVKLMREYCLTFRIVAANDSAKNGRLEIFDPLHAPSDTEIAYTFKYRRPLTGPRDIPVYSIDANYLSYFFNPPANRGLQEIEYDPATGVTKVIVTDQKDTNSAQPTESNAAAADSPRLPALKNAPQITATSSDGTQHKVQPATSTKSGESGDSSSSPVGDNTKRCLVQEASIYSEPMVKIKCPGVVDLAPLDIVKLEGCTKQFDSLYLVNSVRHTISSSGYDMNVTMYRIGSPSGLDLAPTQPKSPPGKNPAALGKDETSGELPTLRSAPPQAPPG